MDIPASGKLVDLPSKVRLDVSTACQLRCPSCPTAKGVIAASLGSKLVSAKQFAAFLRAAPWIREIELSNWGEVFLNPELSEILSFAADAGVGLRIDNGANLNQASIAVLRDVVRFKVRSITCSIDGATNETYAHYRRNGDLKVVLRNVDRINRWKRFFQSDLPVLTWQFIAFGHNEHEIDAAREMALARGMKFRVKLAWNDDDTGEPFSPVRDKERISRESGLGVASRDDYERVYSEQYRQQSICAQLWNAPQVNADGRVLGCCINHWQDFGNAFDGGLEPILTGEPMSYARQMLCGEAPPREDIPCSSCHFYHGMKRSSRWMNSFEMQPQRTQRTQRDS